MQGLERVGHNFGDWIPGYCVIFCHFSIASSCPILPLCHFAIALHPAPISLGLWER